MNSENNENADESGITMVDIMQEEEELEDDAEAVLGPGDDSICTYNKDYVKRQALYACLTCCPVTKDIPAGFCLACSYHCHEGHELVELYTKRNFKCDCGNSKFPQQNPCKLFQEKDDTNKENQYNQNFFGKYCTCGRSYPDPDDTIEDQMIQCIICEDWYHGRHLGGITPPSDGDFSEMICHLCVPKIPFIKYYLGYTVTPMKADDCKENIKVSETTPTKESTVCNNDSDAKDEVLQKESADSCKLKTLKVLSEPNGTLFFVDTWRQELCQCSTCKEMYINHKLSFLIIEEDTVSHYEAEGRSKRSMIRGVQRELDALSSLDRVTRTEVVHGFNNMSSSLREYLRKFAENGKVVRGEDIHEFFAQFSANKKQKGEGMQYFCK